MYCWRLKKYSNIAANIINGPKGIIEPIDLFFNNKDGNTNNNPRTEATNNIIKIDFKPIKMSSSSQKPIEYWSK